MNFKNHQIYCKDRIMKSINNVKNNRKLRKIMSKNTYKLIINYNNLKTNNGNTKNKFKISKAKIRFDKINYKSKNQKIIFLYV